MSVFVYAQLLLAAATPQIPWGERIVRYETCVRAKAEQFELASEPISQTIDAAIAAYSIERAGIVLLALETQSKMPKLTPAQQAAGRENAVKGVDLRLREELTVAMFEKRTSGKRNAQD